MEDVRSAEGCVASCEVMLGLSVRMLDLSPEVMKEFRSIATVLARSLVCTDRIECLSVSVLVLSVWVIADVRSVAMLKRSS